MKSLEDVVRDVRFGIRSLVRTPVVTSAAVVSIALGVTATTSVFSVVDAALFRQPAFDHPKELAILYTTRQIGTQPPIRERWSWPGFRALERMVTSFEGVATFSTSVVAITSGETEPVTAEVVSSGYLPLLRVRPIVGNSFDSADERPGAAPVALLGYEIWQRRFGRDQSIVGRTIALNGVTLRVIGVLPNGFTGLSGRAQLLIPPPVQARISYAAYQTTHQHFISVVGRLKRGVSLSKAQAEMSSIGDAIEREAPGDRQTPDDRVAATAITLNDARVDPSTRSPLLLLLGAVSCLLLLACANVAGLLLGRAVSRRREMAIRIATGASRGRIVRQLMVESALLSTIGGIAGVLIALPVTARLGLPTASWRGRNLYGAISEFSSPRVDVRVLAFAVALCAITVVVFGLVPALQATRLDLTRSLKSGTTLVTVRGWRIEPRRLVIGFETALATVLFVAGGLLASSWRHMANTDVGFDSSHLLAFMVRPSDVLYPPSKAPALIDRLIAAIERVPGVEAASVDGCTPVGTGCASAGLIVMGRPQPGPNEAPGVLRHYVGPNHFRTPGIPLMRGRIFNSTDRAGTPRVAIINQLAAERFWPDEDPIGRRVWFTGGSTFDRPDSSAEIVGIVTNVAHQALDDHPFQPDFYTPYAQFTYATRSVLVRTSRDPLSIVHDIRRAVTSVDQKLALFEVRSMDEQIAMSWRRLSYQTRILAAFAAVALVLAATGVFAIVAYGVSDRRRELGVRIALGASRSQLMAEVSRVATVPAAVGLIGGGFAAALLSRVLVARLYGVGASSAVLVGSPILILVVVVALAAYGAGRRALSVDPVEILKLE